MRAILFPILVAVTAGCASSPLPKMDDMLRDAPVRISRVSVEEDQAALKAFGEDWRTFYMAGNIDALMSLYENDAWLMTNGQPVKRGVKNIRPYFEARAGKAKNLDIVFDYEDITIDEDYGFLTAKWWLAVEVEGVASPIRDQGRSQLIFKRGLDGKWRVWRDIDNHAADVTWEMRPAG